ncbi:MAG: AAA family ATPase [Ginsengibacter sp.]
MQKIDNIEIKNFKSIRHQKIEGCKRVNVFIGYPNVGKSNILEALSSIQYCKMPQGIDLRDLFRFEDAAELFFEANAMQDGIVSYNKLKSVFIKFAHKNLVQMLTTEYSPDAIGIVQANEKNASDLIDVFKYDFKQNLDSNKSNTYKHLQSPFGENLFLMLRENVGLRKSFNEILVNYNLRLLIDKTSNSIKLIKSIDSDSIFQLSYKLLADTLQRLFFYKTAVLTNRNSVLLFEEPEAHMFPPYISKFTNDIVYDENKNQFFITTHSPFVLNDFMDNLKNDELSIYIVSYKKENGETQIHKMSKEDMHEAYQFGYDFFMNIDKFISQEQHG